MSLLASVPAVALKLSEQRAFVLWWDAQDKHPGNRPLRTSNIQPSPTLGLDRVTVHRWRSRLTSDADYEATLDAA